MHAYTSVVEICLAAAAKKDPQVLNCYCIVNFINNKSEIFLNDTVCVISSDDHTKNVFSCNLKLSFFKKIIFGVGSNAGMLSLKL